MGAPFSLRWKVAGAVALLLLVVGAAIGLALVRFERSHLTAEGEKRALVLAKTLAVSARDPLLEADELRLGPVVESIMQDPDAVTAYVLDHEGLVAYHADTRLIGSRGEELVAGKGLLAATVPVVIEGTTVGSASVALSAAFVDRAARATARGLVVPVSLGVALGLIGFVLLTDVQLRRVLRLEHAVGRLADGDLSVRASVRGRDELARLSRGFNAMVAELERARDEIEKGFTDTISALASTIEVKDPYTRGHCERVARCTVAIARQLGVPADDLRDFQLAAMLHDIGKIGVQRRILAKKSKLAEAERREMQEHAELGARILGSVSFLGNVAHIVRHHHENWDGGGYPDALSGEAIPLASRIIRVIDAYDAMTSSRPYRRALSPKEALRRLVAARGTQFAPEIVDVFERLVAEDMIDSILGGADKGVAA